MAKKSSQSGGRGLSRTARASALPRLFASTPVNLALFEDRRVFHPQGRFRPVIALPRSASIVTVGAPGRSQVRAKGPGRGHPPSSLAFAAPSRVILCVRRKRRKEVLFAKNKAGRTGQKRPRRNYWSSISCKR